MSETNLLRAKYALDLRDIRFSIDKREDYEFADISFTSKGLVDITDHSKLNEFSAIIQDRKPDDEKVFFSAGNLNLFALNNRIRMRMLEIFSNILEVNLFELIDQEWNVDDKQGRDMVGSLFSSIFFEKNEDPAVDELLRFWFSFNNNAHEVYSQEFYGGDEDLTLIAENIDNVMEKITTELPEIDEGDIISFLTRPESLFPKSIRKQIEYIIEHWSKYLTQENLKFLLLAMDLIKEEEKFRGVGEPGPAEVYEFDGQSSKTASFYPETADIEQFSQDKDWMPKLVLLAKNIHVWLDQLSTKYNKDISLLSDIPDEELDLLAYRGITGLWLVGLWERSSASKKIKNLTGNEEAISSAYSIHDYVIAEDLGGEKAYENLESRLLHRSIRLGADMVPNHMGISSKWVKEHPDWFIHTKEKPFPSYQYTGEDLSEDPEMEIYLEDHYYDQSDAAVTFKRVDTQTGEVHYIYHGNDGTSFPWNDTAQINFLNEEARENVISTIVEVAKQFPIIRFDAAMVLAKQHIRRLWYPAPGEGGDIPSRSQFSMTDEEFEKKIPNEFWREVVDRVNEEAPDTLLLAEAFWLLEGYFVRTLGMHRVYNSAFMKMLRDEDNAKYRQTIKNVLEYDPEILKRFVNYLTTPDEDPAITEFGTDDKYFGLTTMMVTMPGLPMFGHGQFEGLSEKYGMEFKSARYQEQVNQDLVERHESEIVPLLKKRYLFAGSENFYLYDFFNNKGEVNENVFAFSNRYQGEKALVIYNNKYTHASGWVKRSVAYAEKLDDKTTRLRQVDLFEGLNLSDNDGYLLFRDHVTGLEYIRSKDEIRDSGLFVDVGAFKYHVFVDLKEVDDEEGIWEDIVDQLNGGGTENIQTLYEEISHTYYEKTEEKSETAPQEIAMEKTIDEEKPSIASLKVELSELKDENRTLKGQIKAMTTEMEDKENITSTLDQLERENIRLREKLEKVKQQTVNQEPSDQLNSLKEKLQLRNEEIKNLENRINQLKDEKVSLKSELEVLENKLITTNQEKENLVSQLEQEREKANTFVSKLETKEKKISSLQDRVIKLEEELQTLKGEKQNLSEQLEEEKGYTASQDTLLSSVLLETIMNRLEASSSGIKLRNLAMSLGISASVCLNHVRTMEKKGQVDIKYESDDDSNPLITAIGN